MMIGKLKTDIYKTTKKMRDGTEEITRVERIYLVSKNLVGETILRTTVRRFAARHLLYNSVFPDNKLDTSDWRNLSPPNPYSSQPSYQNDKEK